eukprot:7382616-Prymnesium_polylepis.1
MGYYNACVGTSNYAVVLFAEITGYTAKSKSETRWFSTNDVQELSLLPNHSNGNLLKWADRMIDQGICEKTAPKMRAFLLHSTKVKLFALELTVVVHTGKGLKARNTSLEGDTFEFITGYDTVMRMGSAIKDPITPELSTQIQKLAMANGAAPAPMFVRPATATLGTTAPSGTVLEILSSLAPSVFKTVNLSVDAGYWEWPDEADGSPGVPPQPRYSGKPTSWVTQDKGKEEVRIKFELGRDDEGQPQLDAAGKPKYEATAPALVAKLMQHGLRLEPFDDGAAAPTRSAVPLATESDTHLLSSSDLTDID